MMMKQDNKESILLIMNVYIVIYIIFDIKSSILNPEPAFGTN